MDLRALSLKRKTTQFKPTLVLQTQLFLGIFMDICFNISLSISIPEYLGPNWLQTVTDCQGI